MSEVDPKKIIKEYFTVDELDVVFMALTHRIWSLEDAKLESSYCFPRLVSFREKLRDLFSEEEKINLQISQGIV